MSAPARSPVGPKYAQLSKRYETYTIRSSEITCAIHNLDSNSNIVTMCVTLLRLPFILRTSSSSDLRIRWDPLWCCTISQIGACTLLFKMRCRFGGLFDSATLLRLTPICSWSQFKSAQRSLCVGCGLVVLGVQLVCLGCAMADWWCIGCVWVVSYLCVGCVLVVSWFCLGFVLAVSCCVFQSQFW